MKKKKTVVELTDDFDGSLGAKTLPFAVDGSKYEIELGEKNRAEFFKLLRPYMEKGRKVQGRGKPKEPSAAQVREWAHDMGIEVNPTGRVPQAIIDQYKSTH